MLIPYIPDDAPFTGDQRAWLSGFLAGLHSRMAMPTGSATQSDAAPAAASAPLQILFGSQTGNAESLAQDAADLARKSGLDPHVASLDAVDMNALSAMRRLLIVTSTYGEGEMPDNAQLFWDAVAADTAPTLEGLFFAVLALGDTSYDGYCKAGRDIDARLEALGATRTADRLDCDVEYEDAAATWLSATVPALAAVDGGAPAAAAPAPEAKPAKAASKRSPWNRKNPYRATVLANRVLSGPSSAKEVRHYAFSLGDSGLSYEAGDGLGVKPVNNPELVDALIGRLRVAPDSTVTVKGSEQRLDELLTHSYEIGVPSMDLVEAVAERTGDDELVHVLSTGDREALDAWTWGKDVLDVLALDDKLAFDPAELLGLLRPLQHRVYSISSSPLAHEGTVHLTVASVRYRSAERDRGGVCSTFLADRVAQGESAGVFLSANKSFRLPADDDAPVVMVGPGTGIAPFRAFLHERRARNASGRNWLFFGDQHRGSDYIYEDELDALSRDGVLTKLDLAFSRDQTEKVYVQNRMRENGKELYAWLEEGGHFYVCGDATRMAKDVDAALHDVVAEHGGRTSDQAEDYVAELKRSKRYLRDVY
ncbi:sulfite reductase subunit alpha [Rhodococcoides kyotonense]|uniref:assimilatory sulfite reductase (NADPH) n=1 Tax=Rhodococcoides kyotonense TaxID=398843 RepID=A0A239IIJ2_9NOCA|nr:sulfite reductase subunit alpha [Rhodococcus kyotonensis]SNS92224.1 sulfite reductase (NADPH) flavoprotein alpha-component [Rhodococcus kyotonensis]